MARQYTKVQGLKETVFKLKAEGKTNRYTHWDSVVLHFAAPVCMDHCIIPSALV